MTSHREAVRREFAKQAATFEDPEYAFTDRRLIAWIQRNVPAEPGAAVLDVAGGTGHMARAYADTAAVAVVLDLTEEMLATGHRQTQAAGQRNVVFVRGDAARMYFLEDSFDLVICRFAVHHFESPRRADRRDGAGRRPGGRVAIIDLVAADAGLAAEQDRLERIRDPSHARVLPMPTLRTLLEQAGTPVFHETFHDQPRPVESLLAQAAASPERAEAIRRQLRAELDGGAPTEMRPLIDDDELQLTHRYGIVVARKPMTAAQETRA